MTSTQRWAAAVVPRSVVGVVQESLVGFRDLRCILRPIYTRAEVASVAESVAGGVGLAGVERARAGHDWTLAYIAKSVAVSIYLVSVRDVRAVVASVAV